MIFVGFGFLMTFMKKYGFSAIGLNFLLAAISIQWAIIMQNVWDMKDYKIGISIISLIGGNFASATVLISFGALLGKTSPMQLVVMSVFEITLFACNEHLGVHIYKAADIGGSIFLHTFGAYFGLAVAYMLRSKEAMGSSKEGSNYHSDIFAMI
ncbi:ammonium transporter Rh type A, partial [Trichonephila inaurata madagascariensis]